MTVFVFVSWFADDRAQRGAEYMARARRHVDDLAPSSWTEHCWQGKGWGIYLRQARPGSLKWSFGAQADGIATVSAGLPLGLPPTTPIALARRLLTGEEVHADVCAPFALLAIDEAAGHVSVQQDWHGMGQIFRYAHQGAMAFSNRPSLLPTVIGGVVKPNVRGWSYYLSNGAFAADTSPIRGVDLLEPGEYVTGRRHGTWEFTSSRRRSLDDIVAEAVTERPNIDAITDEAASGIRRVVRGLAHYWDEPLAMGLSGGKDSRMLAAVLVDDGLVSAFRTNEQNPLEGEIALTLSSTLREKRGLNLEHEFYVANPTDDVLGSSLVQRARTLLDRHDYMFRSTYLNRPLATPPPDTFPRPGILGVLGEYVSDSWLPDGWKPDPSLGTHAEAYEVLTRKLTNTMPRRALSDATNERLTDFIDKTFSEAREHGLNPFATISYCYMKGRRRRDSTSLTNVDQVMPFAVPEFIRASIQLTPEQKATKALHLALIDRYMPEWNDVPFVRLKTGVNPDDILRVWHGSGAPELRALLSDGPGPITRLIRRPFVTRSLERIERGEGGAREDATLRQFTMAAVAEKQFGRP